MSITLQSLVTGVALLLTTSPAVTADIAAGKAAAETKCVQCHQAHDWEGEDAPSLEELIRDIVAGEVKHKTQFDLSSAEIVDIAAYWGTGGKK